LASVLFAYLGSRIAQDIILAYSSGGVQRRINLDLLRALAVPSFSSEFQRSIDDCISDAFKTWESAILHSVQSETRLLTALGLTKWQPPEPPTYTLPFSRVFAEGRLDAEFHRPKVDALRRALARRFQLKHLGEIGVVENGQAVPYYEEGDVPIIRSGDLSSIEDDSRFLRARSSMPIYKLERGDVLVSSIGFGSIGKVQVFDKAGIYGTVSEVTVIRQKEFNPYFIAAFLRSRFGQMQIDRYITGATGQLHLYKRDVRKFFLPVLPDQEQKWFEELALEAAAARTHARAALDKAKRGVEITIDDSDAAALKYLREG
jgi:restriction endonuclease S subunit